MYSPIYPRRLFVLVLSVALIMAAGCNTNTSTPTVKGSGTIKIQDRTVANFSEVFVVGGVTVKITQGETESLSIETDDNILPLLTSEVRNGRLFLEIKGAISPTRLEYRITMKALTALETSGSVILTATGISGQNLETKITGSCRCSLSGKVDTQRVEVAGETTYLAKDLIARATFISADGLANMAIWTTEELSVRASGAGTITYYGNPTTVNEEVSGAARAVKGQ